MFLRRIILSTFFSATRTAAYALYADFKFKSYYNVGFHLDAVTSFCCHILRALYDLSAILLRAIITPFCVLNPLSWPNLPNHALNLVDDFVGLTISLVSITIHPIILIIRTLSSMIRGYEEGTNYDQGIDAEKMDLGMAMAIY